MVTYSRSRTLPRSPPRVDFGLSSGVSGVSSSSMGKGVTKGLSSALVGAPLSMVTYSNGFKVTLSVADSVFKAGFLWRGIEAMLGLAAF